MKKMVLAGIICIFFSSPAFSQKNVIFEKRFAFVIGNGNYKELGSLDNSANDAVYLSQRLKKLNFDVKTLTDVKSSVAKNALESFEHKIQPGSAVLFYFSGHGVQIDGHNYLIMSDFNTKNQKQISSVADLIKKNLKEYSISLDDITYMLQKKKLKTKIIILDACRESPSPAFKARGLAALNAPVNTLIAFATAPGKVSYSLTKADNNSLYTKYLLKNIDQENTPVDQMLKKVHKSVYAFSRKVSFDERYDESLVQVPWINSSLIDDFYMKISGPVQLSGNEIGDTKLWYSIKDQKNLKKVKEYTKTYPNGMYIIPAKNKIRQLTSQKEKIPKMNLKKASFSISQAESKSIIKSPNFFIKLDEYLSSSENPIEEINSAAGKKNTLAKLWLLALNTHDRFRINKKIEDIEAYCFNEKLINIPIGHFLLGRAYFFGRSVKPDRKKAIAFIKKAANRGNTPAQNFMGDLFSQGIAVSHDPQKAFHYYMMAANKGYLPGMHNVALAYAEGDGVSQNNFEAVDWYKKAASQGYAWSQNNLAVHYIKGLGISTNIDEALKLINASVRQDNNQGKILLARMHEAGVGVNLNFDKAKSLYKSVIASSSDEELQQVARKSLQRIHGTNE